MRDLVVGVFLCGVMVGLALASLHEQRWGSAAFEVGVALLVGYNAWNHRRKIP